MKRIALSLIFIISILVTACGGSAPASATDVPLQPTATEVSAEPTAPVSADGKVQVQVTEGDNWIKSDITTFKVGVPYVFTITNTGRRDHIFSISAPVTDVTQAGMRDAATSALVFVSDRELSPGAVITVEYTFTEPAPAGTLEFACLILMHYRMGQVLPIVVE
jgi:uncharacterized cupredoxin-like copper-binding protein